MPADTFLCGVIEGFYGRPWDFDLRRAYAGYLWRAGLNACLYCPKADPYLRRRWQRHWPHEEWRALCTLSRTYREQGILWGPGLSPYELYRDYSPPRRRSLRQKIDRLAALEAPLLAILFDDMPGDCDMLAQRQAEIVADIACWAPHSRLLVCPTYYSPDPVLEQHFGTMPSDYWRQLGALLPPRAEVLWTGNQVCSATITAGDIQWIGAQLGRALVLWDNYPVNDGAQRSNFLFTSPPAGRSAALRPLLSGHLCNAMNQGLLSLPALVGLAELYAVEARDAQLLGDTLGAGLLALLARDRDLFQHVGLSGMGDAQRRALAAEYAALPGRAAREVVDWLHGQYRFDPACLTD